MSARIFLLFLFCILLYIPLPESAQAPLALQKMPDPHGQYSNLLARHPHLKTTVAIPPDVRDENGTLILPSDYSDKLGKKTPVFVTVKLRLLVVYSSCAVL